MGMRPATVAAMVILAAILVVPAFLLRMEPVEPPPVNEQCSVVPVDKPAQIHHAPKPKEGDKPKDGAKEPPKDAPKEPGE